MAFANDCIEKAGVPLNAIQSMQLGQGVAGEFKIIIRGPDGQPMDLTPYLATSSSSSSSSSECECNEPNKHGVEFIAKEMPNFPCYLFKKMGTVKAEDAANGVAYLDVTCDMSVAPGVWVAEANLWEHGQKKYTMPFYFYVTGSLANWNPTAPISVSEIRLFMRDKAPEDNFLLDAVEFTDEEIMACIRSPIDEWNAMPPPVGEYTPMNFPWRQPWREAVLGELFTLAAIHMRRNDLDYNAAGVTVTDTKKYPDYFKMGEQRRQEWKVFVQRKKVEINIDQGYTSLGGFYTGG